MNVSNALAVLFAFIRVINPKLTSRTALSSSDKKATLQFFQEVDSVLGLGISEHKKTDIPAEVMQLMTERENARAKQEWARADELRKQITLRGYVIEDTRSGPRIKKS